jgi:hypothetical protein
VAFNWQAFLDRYRVPYNTRGPNTPTNALTVGCPFCGAADPSDHMVVWRSGRWSCWRNHSHRGGHPSKLVQALIGCSVAEAQRITASASPTPTATDLDQITAEMFDDKPAAVRELSFPPEFRPLKNEWACQPFIKYLRGRGIRGSCDYLHWRYGLRYCTRGSFKGRLIFPVMHKGKLISWTGRTIYPVEKLRYKSLTTDAEVAAKQSLSPAVAPINHFVMWHDWLAKANVQELHTFILVEGPFDALKLNTIGEPIVVATCWTGSEPTTKQIDVLRTLAPRFKRRVVISDSDMPEKADKIAAALSTLDFEAVSLPADVDDPAEINSYRQLLTILS